MQIDLSTITASQVDHLMTQTVIPRPVAWVLTEYAGLDRVLSVARPK
jgi:hypothetical protein